MEYLKNGMTVISPCDGSSRIKKGDEFLVSNVRPTNNVDKFKFEVKSRGFLCLLNGCAHLNGKNWIIKKNK
jgi:hypothetical protein